MGVGKSTNLIIDRALRGGALEDRIICSLVPTLVANVPPAMYSLINAARLNSLDPAAYPSCRRRAQ
ncbi:hypothetical protein WT26_30150 [Burkholderia cepacia]|uniref:Uncharacterized protein n=2 Tax=Burkholderia cepacia complex TaxID=87882 RepID=A0A1B4Q1L0_BURCE|nr:hypothetical protein WT26_30150 [Burkholderia cepacia]AOK26839.1 hypothetical protein WK67_30015 [Burkholderia ubonensis]